MEVAPVVVRQLMCKFQEKTIMLSICIAEVEALRSIVHWNFNPSKHVANLALSSVAQIRRKKVHKHEVQYT